MAISFSCPHCEATYQVNDDLGGKKAPCLNCGETIRVPRPQGPVGGPAGGSKKKPRAGRPDSAGTSAAPVPSPEPNTGGDDDALPLDDGIGSPLEDLSIDDLEAAVEKIDSDMNLDFGEDDEPQLADETGDGSGDWDAIFPGDSLVGSPALPAVSVEDTGGPSDGYAPKSASEPDDPFADAPDLFNPPDEDGELELDFDEPPSGGALQGVSDPADEGLPFDPATMGAGTGRSAGSSASASAMGSNFGAGAPIGMPGGAPGQAAPVAAPSSSDGPPAWVWVGAFAAVLIIILLGGIIAILLLRSGDTPVEPDDDTDIALVDDDEQGDDGDTDEPVEATTPRPAPVEPTPPPTPVATASPSRPSAPEVTPAEAITVGAIQRAMEPIPRSAPTWQPNSARTGELSKPLAVGAYALRPPIGWQFDPKASDVRQNRFSWIDPDVSSPKPPRLTMQVQRNPNPAQHRPVVLNDPNPKLPDNAERYVTDIVPNGEVAYGFINRLPATRVQPGILMVQESGERFIRYTVMNGQDLVVVEAQTASGDVIALELANTAALTLSPNPASTVARAIDMFLINTRTPAQLVQMLATNQRDDASRALRMLGGKAEKEVITMLDHGDNQVRREAANILADIGGPASVEPLLATVQSEDRATAMAAKDALRKIAPDRFDSITEALMDLQSKDTARQRIALRQLKDLPRVDGREQEIMEAVEPFLDSNDVTLARYAHEIAGVWLTPDLQRRFTAILSNRDGPPGPRRLAMVALSRSDEPSAAEPITFWLIADTQHAVEALRNMGETAEPALAKLLTSRDTQVRMTVVDLLEDIGTRRSLPALTNISRIRSEPRLSAAAQSAIDAIRKREGLN